MKIISKTILGLLVSTSLISCSDYLDVNESPNEPTADAITPDLLLGGGLTTPYNAFQDRFQNPNELGNIMMNNWGGNVNAFTGVNEDEYRLNITTTFYDRIWDLTYRGIGTLEKIAVNESEDYDNHKAIASIMQSYYFQLLVDFYGDIPYTEALQFGDNYTPGYDDDKAVYRSLIQELDIALALIDDTDAMDKGVGSEDPIFQGDMSQWVKFANTLKLRILVRQTTLAEQDGATATYLNEQFAALDMNFINDDVTINPGYTNSAGKQNTFYANFGSDSEGAPTQNRDATVAADFAAEFMKGLQPNNPNVTTTISTGVPDERVSQYYMEIGGTVFGVVQGANSDTSPDPLSKLGPGILESSSQDGYIMLGAESLLLQSEAVFRGYMGGDAKTLFQDAIRSSYASLDLTSTAAENYITAGNGVNLIGWDGSGNKIEAIMTQKWLATNGRTAQESWIDYRRTGFPKVPLSIIAEKPAKPNRLLYPASEYNTNGANVPQQSQNDAFSTTIFWDVNN